MSHIWILLGILPGLLILRYFHKHDARRPEPSTHLSLALLLGVTATALVGLLNTYVWPRDFGPSADIGDALSKAFFGASIPEEIIKLAAFLIITRTKAFDERADGIVYGAFIGGGFGMLENLLYLEGQSSLGAFFTVFLFRSILSLPLHVGLGAIVGAWFAQKHFDGKGPGVLFGLATAIVIHGVYNTTLFLIPPQSNPFLALAPSAIIVGLTFTLTRVLFIDALRRDDIHEMQTGQVTAGIAFKHPTSETSSAQAHPRLQLLSFGIFFIVLFLFFWAIFEHPITSALYATCVIAMTRGLLLGKMLQPPQRKRAHLSGTIECPSCQSLQTSPFELALDDGTIRHTMRCAACHTEFGGHFGNDTQKYDPADDKKPERRRRRRR